MKATVIYRPGTLQEKWCGAMLDGLKRHGVRAETAHPAPSSVGDFIVCWGWRMARQYVSKRPVLVIELGYAGDRFMWASAGWNGLNGRATFPVVDDCGARWREHFGHLMQPWQHEGEYVLIAGQVAGDSAVQGVGLNLWYAQAAKTLRAVQSLPVMFRPHPVDIQRGTATRVDGVPTLQGSLGEGLEKAALVVTWNSNAGVDAALAGVPVIACDPGSMAWPVAAHGVGAARVWPDRDEWAARLAWCQWSEGELSDGTAWEYLKGCVPW